MLLTSLSFLLASDLAQAFFYCKTLRDVDSPYYDSQENTIHYKGECEATANRIGLPGSFGCYGGTVAELVPAAENVDRTTLAELSNSFGLPTPGGITMGSRGGFRVKTCADCPKHLLPRTSCDYFRSVDDDDDRIGPGHYRYRANCNLTSEKIIYITSDLDACKSFAAALQFYIDSGYTWTTTSTTTMTSTSATITTTTTTVTLTTATTTSITTSTTVRLQVNDMCDPYADVCDKAKNLVCSMDVYECRYGTTSTKITASTEESGQEKASNVGGIAGGAVGGAVFLTIFGVLVYRCGRKKELEEVRHRAPPPGARNQGNQRRGVPRQAYGEATMQNPTFDDSPAPAYAEVDEEPAYVSAVPGRAIIYDQGRLSGARDHALRDKRLLQQSANSHA